MTKRNYGKYGKRRATRRAQSGIAEAQRKRELLEDTSGEGGYVVRLLAESEAATLAAVGEIDAMWRKGQSRRATAERIATEARRRRVGRDIGKIYTGHVVERDGFTVNTSPSPRHAYAEISEPKIDSMALAQVAMPAVEELVRV